MTHKKRPSTEKMYDYKKEKVEFARELGVNGANNTEVNAKMAAQDEAKSSSLSARAFFNLSFNFFNYFFLRCFRLI